MPRFRLIQMCDDEVFRRYRESNKDQYRTTRLDDDFSEVHLLTGELVLRIQILPDSEVEDTVKRLLTPS